MAASIVSTATFGIAGFHVGNLIFILRNLTLPNVMAFNCY